PALSRPRGIGPQPLAHRHQDVPPRAVRPPRPAEPAGGLGRHVRDGDEGRGGGGAAGRGADHLNRSPLRRPVDLPPRSLGGRVPALVPVGRARAPPAEGTPRGPGARATRASRGDREVSRRYLVTGGAGFIGTAI